MAHYLAEKMDVAERSAGDEKAHAEQECFETILRLWSHRREMPDGRRPFEVIENAVSVLDRLDPNRPSYFYHRGIFEAAQDERQTEESAEHAWLKLAEVFDRGARVMIEHCIRMAVAQSVRKDLKWIELAQSLCGAQAMEIVFIERILSDGERLTERKRSIQDHWSTKIDQLRAFVEMAKVLEEDFSAQRSAALRRIDEAPVQDPSKA